MIDVYTVAGCLLLAAMAGWAAGWLAADRHYHKRLHRVRRTAFGTNTLGATVRYTDSPRPLRSGEGPKGSRP